MLPTWPLEIQQIINKRHVLDKFIHLDLDHLPDLVRKEDDKRQ